jgi:iron complex outermembrane receptor protein
MFEARKCVRSGVVVAYRNQTIEGGRKMNPKPKTALLTDAQRKSARFAMKKTNVALAVAGACGALALAASASLAFAQEAERITVTGSSISRASAEGALPVQVLSRQDIERMGATTAQDLVSSIASVFGGTVAANTVGNPGKSGSTANLRALGAQYTLVLLNGRRVADFGFGEKQVVDLNSIPLAAVSRVEVLKDGASSIYGSDAVAGVINFILKEDFQGAEVSLRTSSTSHPGGDGSAVGGVFGFGDLRKDRFNFMLSASQDDTKAVRASDRPFAKTGFRPDLGVMNISSYNGIPNASFTDTRGNSWRNINPARAQGCNAPGMAMVNIGSPTACYFDFAPFIDLVPKQRDQNVVARAVFQVAESHKAYAEYMLSSAEITATYTPGPYTNPFAYPGGGAFYPTSITLPKGMTLPAGTKMPDGSTLAASTVLAADMAVTPTGPITGRWRTVAAGSHRLVTDNDASRLVVGLKGMVANWDYDLAYTDATYKGSAKAGGGYHTYAKLAPLVNSGVINVFGAQTAASQAALDSALFSGTLEDTRSKSQTSEVKLSKDIMQLVNGPLAVALGASYRKETIAQNSNPAFASGDVVGEESVPSVSGGRNISSLYGEAVIPFAKDFEAQLSGRYDKYSSSYSSFDNFSPKVGIRFQPSKELLVRGSATTGFRAPSIYQSMKGVSEGGASPPIFTDPIRCPKGVPINNTVDVAFECSTVMETTSGNVALKPEKSEQFSLGLVFAPTSNLSVSVDYWDIKIDDAITQLSDHTVMNDPTRYANYIYRYNPADYPRGYTNNCSNGVVANACGKLIPGSQNPNYPIAYVYLPLVNASKFFAAGLDLNAQYKYKVNGWGTLGVALDGTLLTKHGYQYVNTTSVSDVGKYKDFGAAPKWRHLLTASFAGANYGASLTQNYTAGYEDFTDPGSVDGTTYPLVRKVSSWVTYDLLLTYRPTKLIDIGFGIKNLTDVDPPSSRVLGNIQSGYDATYATPVGRMAYLTGKIRF